MKIRPRIYHDLVACLDSLGSPGAIRVADVEIYTGPSPYSAEPVIICTIEAAPLALSAATLHKAVSIRFADFSGAPPEDSSAPADAAAIAGLAGQIGAGLLGSFMRIDCRGGAIALSPGTAAFWIEYLAAPTAIQAVKTTLVAIAAAAAGELGDDPGDQVARLKQICLQQRPNLQSKVLMTAARVRDIPFLPVAANPNLWQFGWGSRSLAFWETSSNSDGLLSWHIARNKEVGKQLIRDLGMPTPAWVVLQAGQDPMQAIEVTGWPCAVKPVNKGGGKGVSAGIGSEADLRRAVEIARGYSSHVLIETHQPGFDHRLLVIDGRLAAAVRREAPSVTGDGSATVRALLERFNQGREENIGEGNFLARVKEDAALAATLASEGVTMDSVVDSGRQILLRSNANRSTGGTPFDVLATVHPEIRRMAEELAAAAGFRATGIDYLTPDISRGHAEVGGGFIELNATPGVFVHIAAGMAEAEIGSLFLGDKPGRIPVNLLLAPEASHDLLSAGLAERLTHDPGAAAAGVDWARHGDAPMPRFGLDAISTIAAALRRPTVERLTVLWSCDQLTRFGLPVDRLARTIVVGEGPDPAWSALLERSSGALLRVSDEADAPAIIAEPAAKE